MLACRQVQAPGERRGQRLNVVLVTLDTTRADHLGCYGHPVVKTPHLDRLANQGVRFQQCVTAAPITLPAHVSIMTSTYPFYHGVRDNGRFALHGGNVTLAELLARSGFRTGAIVGSVVLNRRYGLDQGFDLYNEVDESYVPPPASRPTTQEARPPLPRTERKADEVAELAVAWLRTHAAEKFFLWVHFFDPHWPYEPPPQLAASYPHPYLGEIAFMDQQLGKVVEELGRLGLERKTLVVVVGDHGEGLGEHDEDSHTFFLYDTTMLVPLFFRCPGQVPAGRVVSGQVRTIDIAPTILDLLGIRDAAHPDAAGVSLTPLLTGGTDDLRLEAYGDTFRPFYVFQHSGLRCLRWDGWKYIHAPRPELYRVADDPNEQRDLAAQEPQRLAEARDRLRALLAETPSPAWLAESGRVLSADERARLEALGYAMGDRREDQRLGANELARFEPRGEDIKGHTESIRVWSLATAALQTGRFPVAEELYRRLTELEPHSDEFRVKLARARIGQGNTEGAIASLREALAINPASARTHFELAEQLRLAGQAGAAAHHYRQTLALEPDHAEAARRLPEVSAATRPSEGVRKIVESDSPATRPGG